MARRHFYSVPLPSGVYTRNQRQPLADSPTVYQDLRNVAKVAAKYFWTAFTVMGGNYTTLATIFVVVVLSFLLPDMSQKIYVRKEVKAMKEVLDSMSKEVSRAEAACLTVAHEICFMHCNVRDDATETPQELRDFSVCTSSSLRATRSEPVQVEKKIGFFRRVFFPNRNASHKEIAIMSYVYTDSFDAQKPLNETKMIPEI